MSEMPCGGDLWRARDWAAWFELALSDNPNISPCQGCGHFDNKCLGPEGYAFAAAAGIELEGGEMSDERLLSEEWLRAIRMDTAEYVARGGGDYEVEEVIELLDHIDALTEQLKALRADVEALVRESTGVVGLHLNGDVATWEWLMENGWLNALAALEARDEEGTK